ncbi:MAG: diguanylate cyclase (GGDEF)-like protein/PAS domain S-box-containing protein [Gammaproteobacteria bacterium]|jgi:diguanylate cyclase (GGDEF)-like protein/PAS domain S-box-containing protein
MDSEVEKLIRLLIIDEGLHKAEQITSSLRATGMQVRAEFAEDSEDMCAILENKALDLVLFSLDLPDFSLKQAQHLVGECGRHVALVAMTNNLTANFIVQSISEGAQDVVSSNNLDHLIQVIKREAFSLSMWRKAKRMELELMESEKRCQSLLANSKDAVAYVHEGMHIYANEVYMELFGNTDFEELEGIPIIDMVHTSQQNEIKTFLRALSQNENDTNQLDLKLMHDSGEVIEATLEFSRASFDGEPCTQILIRSSVDTSELEQQINYLHQHDLISGLYNRQYFMDELKNSITQAVNGIHRCAIIYVAIDNFQTIRDAVGISGCDVLISDIAKILQGKASEGQIVARFGAYSYAFLAVITDKKLIEDLALDIPVLVEQHISEIGNQSIGATCSTSVCFIDENSPDNPNELIARAEKTCDEVQNKGGNKSRIYIPKAGEMSQEEEDGVINQTLKTALSNNRIDGLYQPMVSIKAEQGARYISSLVLYNEEGKQLHRADYQAAAERTGIAKTLDRWAILHAIKKIAEASKKSRKIEFFIPLSISSVLDVGLAQWIAGSLSKANVSGDQLVFMINEGHVVNQLKATKTLFKGLKQIHCQFGLDEFGTGLNPFQLLKHLDADYVRINFAYMENLAQNSDNQDSIRELSHQASEINVRTITPAVNDAAILSVLWGLGVDFVHGDFLQVPTKNLTYDFSSM